MPAKRKHAATEAEAAAPSNAKPASINDASEEHLEEAISKRARSSVHAKNTSQDDSNDAAIEARLNIKKAPMLNTDGEPVAGDMEEPPMAGHVDPVGYKTNPPPTDRPVRVYADGVFDLFHLGHMRQLEQAKTAFPNTHLTVGVTGDTETHRRKGLTVLSGAERAETVRHCRWVDEVIEDCPWVVSADFLAQHEFDYVAHDDIPYGADEGDDIYKPIKEQGKFLVTQRTEGVSTTGIITKIVRDYEQYIARQLRRGTSRQELNISWLKKNELDLKRHVAELRNNIKTNWSQTGQELGRELKGFWVPSRPQSPAASVRTPSVRSGRGAGTVPTEEAGPSPLKTDANGTPVSAVKHLGYLDIPRSPGPPVSPGSPGGDPSGRGSSDFAKGYAFGLVGGIRSWMTRNRRNVLSGSRPPSPGSSGEDDLQSPRSPTTGESSAEGESGRGRKRVKLTSDEEEDLAAAAASGSRRG